MTIEFNVEYDETDGTFSFYIDGWSSRSTYGDVCKEKLEDWLESHGFV